MMTSFWPLVNNEPLRLCFGFWNANFAAAFFCALLPLCWGWRRWAWVGYTLTAVLFAMILMTFSRMGLFVAVAEGLAYLAMLWRARRVRISKRVIALGVVVGLVVAAVAICWIWPRLRIDFSVANRPKVLWSGLQLCAANPWGVGIGNSGHMVSAFMMGDIPGIGSLINIHLNVLAECGWLAGWVWFVFIILALGGFARRPRAGIAFAGLVLSGMTSTIFSLPALLGQAVSGSYTLLNWALSWLSAALFFELGMLLIAKSAANTSAFWRRVAGSVMCAGLLVFAVRLVPVGGAPRARDGFAFRGPAPRTLVLHDGQWKGWEVVEMYPDRVILPIRPVGRFPENLDWSQIDKVVLMGFYARWASEVKDVPVEVVAARPAAR